MKKEKMAYLEMLRVIALFCVLINHTVNGELFWQELGGKKWFILLVEFLFCRINVPLFLMISGVLLLGRVDTYEKCLRRAFRILVDIVIFSLLYYIWQCHGTGMEVSMAEFRARVLREEITTPLWYLYMYLGILILLPLLQRMAARMEKRDYQYLIVLAIVVCGSLPVAGHYIGWLRLNPNFSEMLLPVYIGIFFCGYYLANYVEIKTKYAVVSGAVLIGSVGFQVYLTWLEAQHEAWYLYVAETNNFPNILSAAAVFYIARWLQTVIKAEWFWKLMMVLGSAMFGAYLLSDFVVTKSRVLFDAMNGRLNIVIALFVWDVAIFAIAAALTFLLKCIPGVKKLV